MIQTKLFELRDKCTFVPVIASLMESYDEREGYLLRRSGYGTGSNLVLMAGIQSSPDKCTYDPYDWFDGSRTRQVAHEYITKNWGELESGDVIDVEFILGESTKPKDSERVTTP